ncbi:MAG TPA: carbohydrate porin [Pseudobdellovibrionaceae bacterium]|nr:carbohydrate porin [Pseudobdellovibrionaceae bacterium]
MKKYFICWVALAGVFFLNPISLWAADGAHGYFRVGAGENLKGGKIDCYRNKGTFGPEFRLGNECSIYGELKLEKELNNETQKNSPFQIGALWAFARNGNSDWEDGDVALRELYSEAQNVDGSGYNIWVGKKYYRWSDVYILDWYPLQFNGLGAGMSKPSNWDITALVESGSTTSNDIGAPAKTSLHWRQENLELLSVKLDTWVAGAVTREHQITTVSSGVTTQYEATQGYLAALKIKSQLLGDSTDFGVVLGQGNLSDLSPSGVSIEKCSNSTDSDCTVSSSNRVLFYSQINFERKEKFSGQAVVAYDRKNLGTQNEGYEEWSSLGLQPVYYFTDQLHLTGLLGYSTVRVSGQNDKTLFRATVGPQVSMGKSFWARPVLRAYLSYNQWNNTNISSMASNTATKDQNSALGLGFQTEAWF